MDDEKLEQMLQDWNCGQRRQVSEQCMELPRSHLVLFSGRLVGFCGYHALNDLYQLMKTQEDEGTSYDDTSCESHDCEQNDQ